MVNEKYKKKYLKYKKKYLKYKKNKIFVGGVSNFTSCVPSRDKSDSCGSFILSLKFRPGGEEVKRYKINPNLKKNIHKYIYVNFIKIIVDEKKNDNPDLFYSYDYEKYRNWFMENIWTRYDLNLPPLKNWLDLNQPNITKFKLDYNWLSSKDEHYKNLQIWLNAHDTHFENIPINDTIEVYIEQSWWDTLENYYDLRDQQIQIFTQLEDIIIKYIDSLSNAGKFLLCQMHANKLNNQLEHEKEESFFFTFFTNSIEGLGQEIIGDRMKTFDIARNREYVCNFTPGDEMSCHTIDEGERDMTSRLIFEGWLDNIPAVKKYIEELCGEMYNNIKDQKRLEISPEGLPPPYPHQDLQPEGKPPSYKMLPLYSSLNLPPASASNALRRSASLRDSSEFATPRHSPQSPR